MKIDNFFSELKRRNACKGAVGYWGAIWVLIKIEPGQLLLRATTRKPTI